MRTGFYQDCEQTVRLYREAAMQGHACAQYYLGLFYKVGKNYSFGLDGSPEDLPEAFTGTGMRTMGARERLPQRIWSPPKPPQKPARGIPSPKPVLDRNITMKDYAETPMQSSPHYATNSRPRIAQAQQRETKLHEESQANQQTSLFQHGRIAINHTDRAESGVIFHRRKKAN